MSGVLSIKFGAARQKRKKLSGLAYLGVRGASGDWRLGEPRRASSVTHSGGQCSSRIAGWDLPRYVPAADMPQMLHSEARHGGEPVRIVAPSQIIAAAERYGIMLSTDRWVIRVQDSREPRL